MKKKSMKLAGLFTLLVLICAGLWSFSRPFGGDFIRIYLDKTLVMEQFLHMDKSIKSVTLQPAHKGRNLNVQYSHCGIAGKTRTLSIRDAQNREIKKWKYKDGGERDLTMSFSVKELMDATKNQSRISLYYVSKELPKGKQLATLVLESTTVASK